MSTTEERSKGHLKKIDRKLKKFQHLLLKETNVVCLTTPTKTLAICNAGLVNGLTQELLFEHFNKFGMLNNIILLPGKSCCFLSYGSVDQAISAYEACNAKLNIAQDKKPIYMLYAEKLPESNEEKVWNHLPDGLVILEDFATLAEETNLLNLCNFDEGKSENMRHRQVKHYGYEFRYDINNVDKDKPMEEKIPSKCDFLWSKLSEKNPKFKNFTPDQLTINHYSPGQGIPHHVDTHSAFEDPLVCLSLGSSIVMEFKNLEKHCCILLPQRSLMIMSGESRYDWTHGIVPRKLDVVKGSKGFTSLERGTRVSFTFRKVLQGDCKCNFKLKCDSFQKSSNIEDTLASKLEKLHVQDIYENIADHFSDTRHKPWPNVLEFVQSFPRGAILVDVGCGNGKYLGRNKDIYDVGCDFSLGLCTICKERNFEVFNANCLKIPLKDQIADGVISIAVIHHMANAERRLLAVKEITRLLRVGGKALIYVWAKDQLKDQEKSSYIKQDRKNRNSNTEDVRTQKEENISVLNNSLSLPVHTNRTQFQSKDVLVPWKLKNQEKQETKKEFLRYYHVFESNELEELCQKLDNIKITKSYYDQGNWCVIFEKIKLSK